MKKRIGILLVTLFCVGCTTELPREEVKELPEPTLWVEKAAISATAAGEMFPVDVKSNSEWLAVVTAGSEWCKIIPTTVVSGNGTIAISVMANSTPNIRSATITVTAVTAGAALAQMITVTQDAANTTLTLDKEEIPATADMKTYPVDVISNDEWKATVTVGSEWCEVSPAQSRGDGIITVIVKENTTSNARSATIAVTAGAVTQTVTVTQAAAAPTPTPTANLTLDKSKIDAIAAAASYSIVVISNSTWEAVSDKAWCTVGPPSPFTGTGVGAITVNVAKNDDATAGRVAKITVIVTTPDTLLTREVMVSQEKTTLTVKLNEPTTNAPAAANTRKTIDVKSNNTWTATVSPSAATWCRVSPSTPTTGDGTITVTMTENTSTSSTREATITVTAGSLTPSVTVTQEKAPIVPKLTVGRTKIEEVGASIGIEPNDTTKVESNSAWKAVVTNGGTWCKVSPLSGTGNGMIRVERTAENTTASTRTATITITTDETPKVTQTVTVTQANNDMIFVEGATGIKLGTESNVTLSDFYIGKYEVTQKKWKDVMDGWPPASAPTGAGVGDNYPMYNVSYEDVQMFLAQLNEKTGKNYRLPTEAEWEYAAAGGNKRPSLNNHYDYSGNNTIDNVAWHSSNSGNATHEVGGKTYNELKIHDMSGNVAEWCSDWYDTLYPSGYLSGTSNPKGPASDSSPYPERVIRGGSWSDFDANCRVDARDHKEPAYKDNTIGFRVALSAP